MEINLHPIVIHFPIALLLTGFILDAAGVILKKEQCGRFAFILYIIGTVGAIGAVITGNLAEDSAKEILGIEHTLEEHEDLGTITMWFFIAMTTGRALLVYLKKFKGAVVYIFVALMLAGMFLVYKTAEHGGTLVYRYGAGVQSLDDK